MEETKYKNTEVGRIPVGWEVYTIDELFDIGNGYTPSKANPSYWNNGTIPWFRMEDIRKNGRILKDSIQHITPIAVKNGKLFPAGSFILSTTATIGEHALLIVDSLANQRFNFLTRKTNRTNLINTMYFFYYMYIVGDWCRDNINAGGLMAVNIDDLKQYECLVPPLAEQERIAGALSAVDSLIDALDARIDKTRNIKQGTMQQLLTGKTRLNGFTDKWKIETVSQCCELVSTNTKIKKSEYKQMGIYPIIDQGQDYICGYTDVDNVFPNGEYIIFGDHTCCVKYVNFPFAQGADGLKVLKTEYNSKFIYYILSNVQIETSYNRHWSILKNIEIPLPSLAEQQRISNILTAIDNELAALEAKREKYVALKSGMLQTLLTGAIRLFPSPK